MTGAGIVYTNNGEVLILKRLDGWWDLPGGGAEKGESAWHAAKRKTKEGIGDSITEKPYAQINDKFTLFFIEKKPKVKLSKEYVAYKWTEKPRELHPKFNWQKIKKYLRENFEEWLYESWQDDMHILINKIKDIDPKANIPTRSDIDKIESAKERLYYTLLLSNKLKDMSHIKKEPTAHYDARSVAVNRAKELGRGGDTGPQQQQQIDKI